MGVRDVSVRLLTCAWVTEAGHGTGQGSALCSPEQRTQLGIVPKHHQQRRTAPPLLRQL